MPDEFAGRLASRRSAATLAFLMAAFGSGGAQTSATLTVVGVAYDSLHQTPLRNAFITLGQSRNTASDSLGRFRFDSVAAGTYRLAMQHDVLDAIGMSGASALVVVSDGLDTVRISVPSLATLWRIACHALPPPDSGILFGTVRGIGGRMRQVGATVTAGWLDLGVDKKVVTQRRWHLDVETDSTGAYALCGVPLTTGVQIRASTDSASTALIDLEPLDQERIERRDLVLGALVGADSSARGVVTGMVSGEKGPLPNARVVADGAAEARTGDDGRFVLRGVLDGTQQIEVRAIGLAPTTVIVDVVAHDTARVDVFLSKVTILDSVQVHAEVIARQRLVLGFLERKRTAISAYFRDSTTIGKSNTLTGVFADMPAVVVHETRGGGLDFFIKGCKRPAMLIVDREKIDAMFVSSVLGAMRPQDIAAIEVYKESPPTELRPPGKTPCDEPTVVIWTKRGWP